MSLDREQLLGVAHAERQRLGRMIQYADPQTWEQPSAADGWWNRDVIAHLAAGDTIAAQLVAGEAPAELEEWRAEHPEGPFDIDAFNAWTVNRRSGLDTREVLTLWGQAAESFLSHCATISDEDWVSRRYDYVARSDRRPLPRADEGRRVVAARRGRARDERSRPERAALADPPHDRPRACACCPGRSGAPASICRD